MEKDNGASVIKTVCGMCHSSCGVNVTVKDGRIVKAAGMPEHLVNKGRLCPKGASIPDYVYSPDRLKHPLKKVKGGWERISWDEALDTIVEKLKWNKEQNGARSLACFVGDRFVTEDFPITDLQRRFLDVYGTPNVFNVDSLCYRIRYINRLLTFGKMTCHDAENAKCIVLWAHNPQSSAPPLDWILRKRRDQIKLIVIDTRATPWAKKADIHAQPIPGTDSALALGMLNVIISEKLYDKETVENHTSGFDKLVEHVKDYPLDKVERITRVPADTIREMARLYATTPPASIIQGTNALDQTSSGSANHRAICILQAITGNFDVPGGFVSPRIHLRRNDIRLLDMLEGQKPLGADEYSLNWDVGGIFFGEGQGMVLPEAILSGKPYPIKMMIVTACNMLRSLPNSNKQRKALESLDFLVVMDIYMTETAELADIVLPAATFLERTEPIFSYYPVLENVSYIMLRKKIMQYEECRADGDFWLELAKRMGYQEYFPWENLEELYDHFLEPSGFTVKQLRDENPEGVKWSEMQYNRYKTRGLRTPSGKIEIYSTILEELGLEPLPTYTEPAESRESTPELAKEFPLVLTTGARELPFIHSQLHNLPKLRKLRPEPTAEIHPETAARYGIGEGQMMTIETTRGAIEMKAELTEGIIPDVVCIPHAWAGANANLLTDEKPVEAAMGYPALKALLCRVSAVT